MLHPLLRTLTAEPELLLEHAGGYLQLAGAEAQALGQAWRRRALLAACTLLAALCGLLLAGVALLLWATTPPAQHQQPWLLVLVPALPLALAALGTWRLLRRPPIQAFALLRAQLAIDGQLLRPSQPAGNAAP